MSQPANEGVPGARLSETERNRLVEDHLPLVHHVLGRLPLRLPQTLDREDLFETGVLGLMSAAQTYNPGKGASFKTHAYVNIRGAILDEIRRHDPIPRSRRDRVRQLSEGDKTLRAALGRPPTAAELAVHLNLKIEQVEDALINEYGATVVSTEDPTSGDPGSRLGDSLQHASSPNPLEEASHREQLVQLLGGLRSLTERDRQVLILYYGNELRLKEIGEILSITESRVSQLLTRAVERLRELLEGKTQSDKSPRGTSRKPSILHTTIPVKRRLLADLESATEQ